MLTGASEELHLFAYDLGVVPFPTIDVIVIKVVYLYIWHKPRFKRLFSESSPVEVLEPTMTYYLIYSVDADALVWLPDQAFVNEVSAFAGVAGRKVPSFQLNGFLED